MTDSNISWTERDEDGLPPPDPHREFRDLVRNAALTALDQLRGTTADEVAAKLRALGVTGVPGDCSLCPVAKHVRRAVTAGTDPGDEVDVETDGVGLTVTRYGPSDPGDLGYAEQVTISLNVDQRLQDFMEKFDRGDYPDLVARDAPPDTDLQEGE